jgi:hypothetical protein
MEMEAAVNFNVEHKRPVFNLRKSASSADEFLYPQMTQIEDKAFAFKTSPLSPYTGHTTLHHDCRDPGRFNPYCAGRPQCH